MNKRVKGNGTVYQRNDGRWVARYKGRTHYTQSEAAAKRELAQMKTDIKCDITAIQKLTVEQAMTKWLATYANSVKPLSFDRKESSCRMQVFPYIGGLQVAAVKPSDIESMVGELSKRGYSVSTIKKAVEAVSGFFRHYIKMKELFENPAEHIIISARHSQWSHNIKCFSETEAVAIQNECLASLSGCSPKCLYADLYIFLLNTGLRIGEALALRETDFDLERRVVKVCKNVVSIKNRGGGARITVVQQTTKTRSGVREVPLNDYALEAAKRMLASNVNGNLVASTSGNTPCFSSVDKSFRSLLKRLEMPQEKMYGVHALRHTFATRLVRKGVDIKLVSKLLGHSSVKITYDYYIHFAESDLSEAVNVLL